MPDSARLTAALGGRYAIEHELGRGGMATVYLARDVKHDREVAIKVLRPELAAVLGAERFLREIRISAKLDHPHILTLIDSGEEDGFLWYVLPYVRGESLRDRLTREKQLSVDDALAITRHIASALEYAHSHGVIHRDIKPENILLHEGEAMLADFGIALAVREAGGDRLTEWGVSLGTPQYMSPEQTTGDQELDVRSDIYSLGAVLYEMLAGEPPHTGPTAQAIIARLLTEEPTSLRVLRRTVPVSVEATVERALAKVPADRFPSAMELIESLNDRQAPATPRRRIHAGWLAPLSAVLALGVLLTWRPWKSAEQTALVRASLVAITSTGAARAPAVSPEGSGVAYLASSCPGADVSCPWDLVWQDIGGGPPLRLLPSAAEESDEWPQLRWVDRSTLVLMDLDNDRTVVVSRTGGTRRFLRGVLLGLGTADTVLTTNSFLDSQTVYTIAAGSGLVADSFRFTQGFVIRVEGSPNGRWRAIIVRPTASLAGRPASLVIVDRHWRVIDTVASQLPMAGNVQWSPTSDALYFFRPQGRGAKFELVRQPIDPATGHKRRAAAVLLDRIATVSSTLFAPSFDLSRDGRTLVVDDLKGRTYEYRTLTLMGASRAASTARLFRLSTVFSPFDLAPDGRSVVLEVPENESDSAAFRLQVSPLDNDAPVLVGEAFPAGTEWRLRRDGAGLFLVQTTGGRMRWATMDLSSGQVTQWHEIAPPAGQLTDLEGGVLWLSPDGSRLSRFDSLGREDRVATWPPGGVKGFYMTTAPDGGSVAIVGFSESDSALTMHVLSLSGDSLTRIGHQAYSENFWWLDPIWVDDQPGMRTFNYRTHGPRLLMPGRGDHLAVRVELPQGYSWFDVSRDGRLVFAVVKMTRSDIALIRLDGRP